MNPLGKLPDHPSADVPKLVRMALVFAIAGGIDYAVPLLTGFDWKFNGFQVPQFVVLGVLNQLVEGGRRYIASSGVAVPKSGSLAEAAGKSVEALVAEAVAEQMARDHPTAEQKAEQVARLEIEIEAIKAKP